MFSSVAGYRSSDSLVGGVSETDKVAISSEVVSGMGYGKDDDMIFVSRQSFLLK